MTRASTTVNAPSTSGPARWNRLFSIVMLIGLGAVLLHLQAEHSERIIEVSWGRDVRTGYEVDIGIEAYDRAGLLRDITELLALARVNVLSVSTETNRKSHLATMRLRVEVPDLTFLGKLLNRIGGLNNVISAVRLSDTGVERAG